MPPAKPAIRPSSVPATNDNETTTTADRQRQPRAVQQAREHIASDIIGAERIGADRRPADAELPSRICTFGSMRRQQRREDRGDDQQRHQAKPDHAAAAGA